MADLTALLPQIPHDLKSPIKTTLNAAADVGLKIIEAASATGNLIEGENSSNKDAFVVGPSGRITRMQLLSFTITTMATNASASASNSLWGITTDDALLGIAPGGGGEFGQSSLSGYVSGANTITVKVNTGITMASQSLWAWALLPTVEA